MSAMQDSVHLANRVVAFALDAPIVVTARLQASA